jgi:Recombination endonuclease VII
MVSRQDILRARQERENAARRKRYAEDLEYRERILARNRKSYATHEFAARKRKRYAEDPAFRKRVRDTNRASRTAHRDEINARKRHRLRTDAAYREKLYTARYGLSPEEYHEMLRQQGGVCAICRKPGRVLVMDHCHATNVVRRPLCRKYNTGLGQFDDDPDALRAAAAYVEAFGARRRKKKTTTLNLTPSGGRTYRRRRWRLGHKPQHGIYHFLRARGFETSRAVSMKSCAMGLTVRFFRVIIPTGTLAYRSLTGKTLIPGRLENLNTEIGTIVRKRPVARRLSRTAGGAAKTVVRG